MKFNLDFFNTPKVTLGEKRKFENEKELLINEIKNESFGFLKELKKPRFTEIEQLISLLNKFENVIFLGTGGSSLGGKTLTSLNNGSSKDKETPKIFFLENVDQTTIINISDQINVEKTAVVVISKSGETIETISQLFFFFNLYDVKKIPKSAHFFVITENKKSSLKSIQESENLYFLEHSKDIGGRFSVFSVVGLVPASLSKFNIYDFCNSGVAFIERIVANSEQFDFFFLSSLYQYCLMKKSINISVIMPYVDALSNFSLWYRQLIAESSGKNGFGLTPVNSIGTIDQHSQLQLYLDGPANKFFTIISRKKLKSKKLNCSTKKNNFELLDGKSLEDLLIAEMRATSETLVKKGASLRIIELESINEKCIGELMAFFILETVLICNLLGINTFDQPAVEEGKLLTKRFLNEE